MFHYPPFHQTDYVIEEGNETTAWKILNSKKAKTKLNPIVDIPVAIFHSM